MRDVYTGLNEEQKLCVAATEGAVLVLAGAGSGKTRVLTHRIANLIDCCNVNPNNILAITFTNKAANEMRERLNKMGLNTDGIWVTTIHSMCNRILRQFIHLLGYQKSFSIYDEGDKERVLKRIITDLKKEADADFLKRVKWHIANAKTNFITPQDYATSGFDDKDFETIVKIYSIYEKELFKSSSLDFDDLIFKAYRVLTEFEECREYFQNKFKYIHIDEFQDTAFGQYLLVKILASKYKNIFAVGDDDQSIYGWRGAEIENVFKFQKDFPSVKVLKLERNYRSTKKILEFANHIIKNNHNRMEKKLWTENSDGVRVDKFVAEDEGKEAYYVSSVIKSLIEYNGYNYNDFAVLVRLNALSRSFEQEFLKYNIPYKVYGGFKFYERKEIKDITAYLRLIINPFDEESLLRVINFPKRAIGDTAVEKLRNVARQNDLSLYDVILNIERVEELPPLLVKKVIGFKNVIISLMHAYELNEPEDFIKKIPIITGIAAAFAENTEENINRKLNLDEFASSYVDFFNDNEGSTLEDFLTSVALVNETEEESADNSVKIATIHSVKGLEFKSIFICGLDDGIFPMARAFTEPKELEEERRLMYVAITRAEERLYLTRAKSRFLYGNRKYMAPSIFLNELSIFFESDKKPLMADKSESYNSRYSKNSGYEDSYYNDNYTDNTAKSSSFVKNNYVSEREKRMIAASHNNADYQDIKTGVKVSHKKFGVGTVISLSGSGSGKSASIAFEKIGIKTITLSMAQLKVLD